jgi:hypothetical protein
MQVTKQDLKWAAEQGVIEAAQVDALWRALGERTEDNPKFDLINLVYFFGAFMVIGAMGWLMTSAWEEFGGAGIFAIAVTYATVFVLFGAKLWHRDGLKVPGGLLITMAVCMTPLAVYGIQRWTGLWGFDDPGAYKDFHRWIRGGWFTIEIATIAAGLIALKFFRFPFLTAPIAFTLWYMSMDLTPILADSVTASVGHLRKLVSVWFGLAMIVGAYLIDQRTKRDFAFWGYLFGMTAFWCGLSLLDSGSEISKFLYFLVNIVTMGAAIFLRRVVFVAYGAIGAFGYLGHLAFEVFEDSLPFPFVLTIVGVATIYLGVKLKRNFNRIEEALESAVPDWMKRLRPEERVGQS